MTEDQADQEARRRNFVLAGDEDRFWVSVRTEADEWDVALREEQRGRFARFFNAIGRGLPPGP